MFKIFKIDKKYTIILLLIFAILGFFSFASIYLQFEAFKLLFIDTDKKIQQFLLLQLLSFMFEFLYRVLQPIINIFVDKQITKIIINKKINLISTLSKYSPKYFGKFGQSELIYDLENNINDYFSAYIQNFYIMIFNIFIFSFLVLFVILQSILFSVWILIILLLIFVAIFISFLIPLIFMKKNQKNSNILLETRSQKLSIFAELIKGYKYFYAHNKTKNFEEQLFDKLDEISKLNLKFNNKKIFTNFVELSLNSFVNQTLFISTILLTFLNPINNLIILILEPIFDGLKYSAESTIARNKDTKLLKPLLHTFKKYDKSFVDGEQQEIFEIKKINFLDFNLKINKKKKMLYSKNLNLEFVLGKKYFIVGKSGSGKTTLVKSIFKDNLSFSGQVKINNLDVLEIKEQSIFNHLIYIDNLDILFIGNVKEAITLFDENIAQEKLSYSLEKALIDFDLSLDYQQLSTGQKQRVKIAWCFYYEKKVIIFDEALSNLDNQTSIAIENNILALKDVLFIQISHYPNLINGHHYQLINL